MIKAEGFKWLDRVYHLFYLASYLCLSGALTDCFLPLYGRLCEVIKNSCIKGTSVGLFRTIRCTPMYSIPMLLSTGAGCNDHLLHDARGCCDSVIISADVTRWGLVLFCCHAIFEPRCEKIGFLQMRKQRRKSASR